MLESARQVDSLPLLLHEAKALIKKMRQRFPVQCPILPPQLSLPQPPLTDERLKIARSEFESLIGVLRGSRPALELLQGALNEAKQRWQLAQERVASLQEQADRHQGPLRASFSVKMVKAREVLQSLVTGGIEGKLAFLEKAIQETVCRINGAIHSATEKLRALESAERAVAAETVAPVINKTNSQAEEPKTFRVWGMFHEPDLERLQDGEARERPKPPEHPFPFFPYLTPNSWSFEEYLEDCMLAEPDILAIQKLLKRP